MRRHYTAPPSETRCKADIVLRDGSGSQCMRAAVKDGYCRQHSKSMCLHCGHSPSEHKQTTNRDRCTTRLDCIHNDCSGYEPDTRSDETKASDEFEMRWLAKRYGTIAPNTCTPTHHLWPQPDRCACGKYRSSGRYVPPEDLRHDPEHLKPEEGGNKADDHWNE